MPRKTRKGPGFSTFPARESARGGVRFTEATAVAWAPQIEKILPQAALNLLVRAHRELEGERQALLEARRKRQAAWDRGELPGFLSPAESGEARGTWRVAPLPPDLRRRRVEITGPVNDTKLVLNMLGRTADGHRADAAMLDFEDSMKPSWANVVHGLENLRGAADGTLIYVRSPATGRPGKRYGVDLEDRPLLMVRCRGLHLDEVNVRVDDRPVSAGLFDLTLSVFHTAGLLLEQGRTPKYYVPKCEHYLEARWWNRLFRLLEDALVLPRGTLRVTFLVETLPAAFQAEEILYELRERAAALNVGRWDKIFSDIKVLGRHPDRVLADRGSISLERPWMRDYALHLVRVCHRHGALALGGMAAFTPGRTAELRERQTRKVVEDKALEASMGHDGCWVSHPYFIGPALSCFPSPNQTDRIPEGKERPDLLPVSTDPKTVEGLRKNVRVGIAYLEGWLRDVGCIAWDDLMEDLATLEISRAQTWQWLEHEVVLDDGRPVTRDRVRRIFREESDRIRRELEEEAADTAGDPGSASARIQAFGVAAEIAERIFTEERLRPFLTCRSEPAGIDGRIRRSLLQRDICVSRPGKPGGEALERNDRGFP